MKQLTITDLKKIYEENNDANVFVLEIFDNINITVENCVQVSRFSPFMTHLNDNVKVFRTLEDRRNFKLNRGEKQLVTDEPVYAIGQKWKFLGDDSPCITKGRTYEVEEIVNGKPKITLDDGCPFVMGTSKFWQLVTDEPTFDDLIDVVTQAYKDKLLSMYSVGGGGSVILKYWIDNSPIRVLRGEIEHDVYRETNIGAVIKHIQSLYKETFVINDMNDIVNINKDAVTTLQNGCIFNGNDFKELQTEPKRLLEILKGATVGQAK